MIAYDKLLSLRKEDKVTQQQNSDYQQETNLSITYMITFHLIK